MKLLSNVQFTGHLPFSAHSCYIACVVSGNKAKNCEQGN